jgi:hypothetical protein
VFVTFSLSNMCSITQSTINEMTRYVVILSSSRMIRVCLPTRMAFLVFAILSRSSLRITQSLIQIPEILCPGGLPNLSNSSFTIRRSIARVADSFVNKLQIQIDMP